METKKAYKSFLYKTTVSWKSALRGALASAGKAEIEVGNPPEFRGQAGVWCPEDLLVGALNTCLMLTFIVFAERRGVGLVSYESNAEGLLEHVEGKYRVTQVTVEPRIVVKSQADLELARQLIEKVEDNCFISNSITAGVKFVPQIQITE
ncbi:MAG TPA: OsmC family protein [Terriglobia bacterium]|nr:OsmC family protein [Terriglobia bacterium]